MLMNIRKVEMEAKRTEEEAIKAAERAKMAEREAKRVGEQAKEAKEEANRAKEEAIEAIDRAKKAEIEAVRVSREAREAEKLALLMMKKLEKSSDENVIRKNVLLGDVAHEKAKKVVGQNYQSRLQISITSFFNSLRV